MIAIAIDFDGVIHKYSKGWQDGSIYDEPVEGVFQALYSLLARDYKLYIFTTRDDHQLVRDWILKYDPFLAEMLEITNQKPLAKFYIDDRAIRFIDWNSTIKFIEENEALA